MSRKNRSYLPGAAFHLTSRTNDKQHWFDADVRSAIVHIVAHTLKRTDAQLIGYAIMSNHFHFIVRQGVAPLARLMQPICRRTALHVRRKLARDGHIFARPFFDKPCANADHLRQALYYAHRNPVEAGMCMQATDYAWSSHHAYAGTVATCQAEHALPALRLTPMPDLFACTADATAEDMYAGYMRFSRWREECDQLPEGVPRPPGPVFPWGDVCWAQRFRPMPLVGDRYVPDLRDLVLQGLRELAPETPLEVLRLRRGGRAMTAVRWEIIARAIAAGHRAVAIARFLNVSETTISRVADRVFVRQNAVASATPRDSSRAAARK